MSDITTRIGALLSKAEGTTNDIERDTYIAKAQELATKYAIDMEAARLAAGGEARRETPGLRGSNYSGTGMTDHKRGHSLCPSTWLSVKPTTTRFLTDRESRYVVAHGFQRTSTSRHRCTTALSLQMVSASERYIKTGDWKDRSGFFDRQGEWRLMTARTARRSFYLGFADTIGKRCIEAQRNMMNEEVNVNGTTTTGALVLAGRNGEVDRFYASVPKGRGSREEVVPSVAQPTAQARRQAGLPRWVTAAQYALVVQQSTTRRRKRDSSEDSHRLRYRRHLGRMDYPISRSYTRNRGRNTA